jgi:hypothetical protein
MGGKGEGGVIRAGVVLTLKAIPGAIIGSNFGKTIFSKYKGVTNEKKITKFLT